MKILFLGADDCYFLSHRLALLRAVRAGGNSVVIVTRGGHCRDRLEAEGFRVIPWTVSRGSLNPLREIRSFFQILTICRRERPELVHHFALKPVLYGGMVARLLGGMKVVSSITGLGYALMSESRRMRLLRGPLTRILRFVLQDDQGRCLFHNPTDRDMLIRMDVVRPELTRVIRGSGVDLERFVPAPVPSGMPVIMLASRMLWEKGVGEFASAAEVCLRQGLRAKFVLVGEPDPDRISASVPVTQIRSWVQAGLVEWWGKQTDMAATLSQASVVCLPSYWEGLPKVLIEAAACGRALVASDIPGCREIAREGVNALLVPVGDAQALAHAISRLVKDPALRGRMGEESRKIAVEAFSDVQVANEIVSVYSELFSGHVSDLPVTEVSSL